MSVLSIAPILTTGTPLAIVSLSIAEPGKTGDASEACAGERLAWGNGKVRSREPAEGKGTMAYRAYKVRGWLYVPVLDKPTFPLTLPPTCESLELAESAEAAKQQFSARHDMLRGAGLCLRVAVYRIPGKVPNV